MHFKQVQRFIKRKKHFGTMGTLTLNVNISTGANAQTAPLSELPSLRSAGAVRTSTGAARECLKWKKIENALHSIQAMLHVA